MKEKKVKIPSTMTQAEMFGVNELNMAKTNDRGIGRLPCPYPDGDMLCYEKGKWRHTMAVQLEMFLRKCKATGAYEHPVANPLPWHWDMTSCEIPIVCDANNVEVFRFGDNDTDEADWANAELIVACVNKFAASISDEELDRMRKRQVYGDENHKED